MLDSPKDGLCKNENIENYNLDGGESPNEISSTKKPLSKKVKT